VKITPGGAKDQQAPPLPLSCWVRYSRF
jgi:hypothetical protein